MKTLTTEQCGDIIDCIYDRYFRRLHGSDGKEAYKFALCLWLSHNHDGQGDPYYSLMDSLDVQFGPLFRDVDIVEGAEGWQTEHDMYHTLTDDMIISAIRDVLDDE